MEYHKNHDDNLVAKLKKYGVNFQLLELGRPETEQYHIGVCVNEAIKLAKGEILVIPDGDVVVEKNFLNEVYQSFQLGETKTTLYFRRWDEPKELHSSEKSYDREYLREVCTLENPTNYGGCCVVNKSAFQQIGNYVTHRIFSGPGPIGRDQYFRFRNAGFSVKWSQSKIYHPYHKGTLSEGIDLQKVKFLNYLYPWSFGISAELAWSVFCRDKTLSFLSDDSIIDQYLKTMPTVHLSNKVWKRYVFRSKVLRLIDRTLHLGQ